MSHPSYNAVSAEIPVNDPERMKIFQELMNQAHDQLNSHVSGLSQELNISESDAGSIYMLRTRSRWTQELENRLIRAFKAGHTIIVNGEEEARLVELGF